MGNISRYPHNLGISMTLILLAFTSVSLFINRNFELISLEALGIEPGTAALQTKLLTITLLALDENLQSYWTKSLSIYAAIALQSRKWDQSLCMPKFFSIS